MPSTASNQAQSTMEQSQEQPPCPMCNSPLLLLRGTWLCGRCHFTLCEDCDGGTAENFFEGRK
jgi:hypothetical protein